MRRIAILGALGLVAALVSGCALDVGENLPAPGEGPTGEDEQAFDASLFKFNVWTPDDGQGRGGGSQRAVATLKFVDIRDESLFGKKWNCFVVVSMPLRANYVTIQADRAAQMTAEAADVAGSTVMRSQPAWPVSVIFCKRFAEMTEKLLNQTPGGPTGARVTAQ